MPVYHKCEPRSEEWRKLRLGIPTASEAHKIVTPTGKLSKQAEGYAHLLLAELMLGRELDDVQTEYMVRGVELEDKAIDSYEFATTRETSPGGFITVDDGSYGCSPDRLVGDDGILEMKCPAANTHVGYLDDPLSMAIDKQPQTQMQLLVTGRDFVDLVSYHPELPLLVQRVKRDERYIDILRVALAAFCQQLISMRRHLEGRYGPFPPIGVKAAVDDSFGVTDADIDEMIAQGAIEL